MPEKRQLTLGQMKVGQTGTVVQVLSDLGFIGHRGSGFMRRHGPGFMRRHGPGFVQRLEALGIRPGKKVAKVSSTLFRGPVTLRVDNAEVAVGFGMANRIIVEVDTST
ncbi:MAG TPA: ferrous iron transport protein A [Dehalococcoidia bacterium]|nr:ferrous iron transport protein A [Dehalococcoidia bacterium]